jgi:Na+-driven multidrug efflux pump
MGVAGAAIASLVAVAIGSVWLTFYFLPHDSYRFARATGRRKARCGAGCWASGCPPTPSSG